MEELKLLIQGMKKDMDNKFLAMETQISQLEEKISSKVNTHMNKKFEDLNRDLHDLRSRLENQEKRLYHLERASVERKLVFFGVVENERSYFDLQSSIMQIVDKNIGIPIQGVEIQSVKRLGKKGNKPRPVSVELTTLGTKINILKNKRRLEGSDMYVTPEFPVPILEKRKILKVQLKNELEKGNTAYLKYDKLIIKEKNTSKTNKKRQLSLSPSQSKYDFSSNMTRKNESTSQNTAKKYRSQKNTMHSYMNKQNEE